MLGSSMTKAVAIVLFVVSFFILHFFIKFHTNPYSKFAEAKVGQKAKSFEGKTIDEKKFSLDTVAKSHELTILNFWESWCGPCMLEMPDLQKIYSDHKKNGLEIIAIYQNSSSDSVKEMIQKHSLTYPIIWDEDGSISREFSVKAVPTTIVADKELKVLRSHQGLDLNLKNFVESFFKGKNK